MGSIHLEKVPATTWLTLREASEYLRVNPQFLRLRVRTRSIPFTRAGSKLLRFRRQDLDDWMSGPRISRGHAIG